MKSGNRNSPTARSRSFWNTHAGRRRTIADMSARYRTRHPRARPAGEKEVSNNSCAGTSTPVDDERGLRELDREQRPRATARRAMHHRLTAPRPRARSTAPLPQRFWPRTRTVRCPGSTSCAVKSVSRPRLATSAPIAPGQRPTRRMSPRGSSSTATTQSRPCRRDPTPGARSVAGHGDALHTWTGSAGSEPGHRIVDQRARGGAADREWRGAAGRLHRHVGGPAPARVGIVGVIEVAASATQPIAGLLRRPDRAGLGRCPAAPAAADGRPRRRGRWDAR